MEKNEEKNDYRNILALWFGAFMTVKRKRAGVAFEELRDVLGLSEQYIRMAENGLTAISPGRTYDLIRGMQRAFELDVLYSSLSSWLVAMQVMPTQGTMTTIKEAMEKLLTADSKGLVKLLRYLEPNHLQLLEQENYQELKAIFSGDNFIEPMQLFLTTSTYGIADKAKIELDLNTMYDNAPSFWNNFISKEIKRLDQHLKDIERNQPYHNIVDWEYNNLGQVETFFGVVSNIGTLLEYVASYDWNDYFKKNIPFFIYILDQPSKEEPNVIDGFYKAVMKEYKEEIKNIDSLKEIMKVDELIMDKTDSLKKILEIKQAEQSIKDENSNKKNYFDCWIYTIKPEKLNIGFVFDSNDRAYYKTGKSPKLLSYLDMENQVHRYRNLTNSQIAEVYRITGHPRDESSNE